MSLLAEERKQYILDWLEREGKAMVVGLAAQLEVSTETVRRDMAALEKEGKLKRVYGGAVKPTFHNREAPYEQRQKVHQAGKEAIGRAAAELVQDGSTIAIDAGTTPLELAKAIRGKMRLTVLTNSLSVAACLLELAGQERFSGKVILLGGELKPEQQAVNGPICEQMARQFRVDQAFLSIGGISLTHGVTDFDPSEASMSRTFAEIAQEVIVLADHSKLGISTFAYIMPLEKVDVIVTDAPCPADWTSELGTKHVQWVRAMDEEGDNGC
ncbi:MULTISPECIES: DeoR/GlpR family DNA-binding transcription regulator [Paenibacillus]|uniref:DeoR/GlpR family DNA-binding transcription regulator n=1 Tax=Paenibacillus TaxID=44249 RepID=UPI0022B88182|nr:DeoR/GlpR family DNA-binding transcription regulator [Paenibacillus caseinilyticus]MCZ8521327.1 DeoR/GlpR family DNA-binding transcription regulator [Paenibacillus caseinilyticus]